MQIAYAKLNCTITPITNSNPNPVPNVGAVKRMFTFTIMITENSKIHQLLYVNFHRKQI